MKLHKVIKKLIINLDPILNIINNEHTQNIEHNEYKEHTPNIEHVEFQT